MAADDRVILLTEIVSEEDGQYVSHCPELGTASCGSTIDEAFANLQEAIDVHLNALEEVGERERVFSERDITIISLTDVGAGWATPYRPTPPVGHVVRTTQHAIQALA